MKRIPLYATKAEFARARGLDPRYVKCRLPAPVARLVAGHKLIDLYDYTEVIAPAICVNTDPRTPNQSADL